MSITGEMPDIMFAGEEIKIRAAMENVGGAILVNAPPFPVHVSYKWLDPATEQCLPGVEGKRTILQRALVPRQPQQIDVAVQAPPNPGTYVLALTLVQEGIAWFDDVSAENALRAAVEIVAAPIAAARDVGPAIAISPPG